MSVGRVMRMGEATAGMSVVELITNIMGRVGFFARERRICCLPRMKPIHAVYTAMRRGRDM